MTRSDIDLMSDVVTWQTFQLPASVLVGSVHLNICLGQPEGRNHFKEK